MARTRTDAAERRLQRGTTVAAVSQELGRQVTIEEAAAHRRLQKLQPLITGQYYLTPTGEVDVDGAKVNEIGNILGRPVDMKMMRGGYTQVTFQTAPEFAHVLVDVQRIAVGHPVLITFSEIIPVESLDNDD